MIIYNVTINIDDDVHQQWVDFMVNQHIPDVIKTGYFLEFIFTKVLSDDPQGKTYSIQYLCNSMNDYEEYKLKESERLQKEHAALFAGKFVAFRTLLEVINQQKYN